MRRFLVVATLIVVAFLLGFAMSDMFGSLQQSKAKIDNMSYIALVNGTYENMPKPDNLRDIERITQYPNIEGVMEVITDSNLIEYRMQITTTDDIQPVLTFYNMALPKEGWTPLDENSSPNHWRDYKWQDKTRTLPFGLHLHITTNTRTPKGTVIYLVERRWPEISKLLVYPGASHIETMTSKPEDYEDQAQTTTYTVDASIEEIETYYKATLIQHGWEHIEVGSESDARGIKQRPGMKFRSLLFGGKILRIVAEQDVNSMVKVEIRLAQFELLLPK